MVSDEHERILARDKPSYDGAEPSGNSVALMNLLRLYEFTARESYRKAADALLLAFGGTLERQPTSLGEMLLALDYRLARPLEIVIVTAGPRAEAAPFLGVLRQVYLPHRVLVVASEAEDLAAGSARIPQLVNRFARDGRTTAYVCRDRVCQLPTTDPDRFHEQLRRAAAPAEAAARAGSESR